MSFISQQNKVRLSLHKTRRPSVELKVVWTDTYSQPATGESDE